MRIKLYIALFLAITAGAVCSAQSGIGAQGTDFWLGFLQNGTPDNIGQTISLQLTSESNTAGVVSIPGQNWQQAFSCTPGTNTTVILPAALAQVTTQQTPESRAVHISSESAVSAYATNFRSSTKDGTLVLPTPLLGTDYVVAAWRGVNDSFDFHSQLLVVATEDGTEVQITPTAATSAGNAAGVSFNVLLNAGQTYRVTAASITGDLTGTRITGTAQSGRCRPFAVFSGSECASVPATCSYCDHLMQQCYPLQMLGTHYYAVPFSGMNGFTLRAIATEDNTLVQLDGGSTQVLNAGQYAEWNSQLSARSITANKPIAVAQYMEGISCTGAGDPSLVLLQPITAKQGTVNFATPAAPDLGAHHLNIVINASETTSLWLDGSNTGFTFVPFAADASMVWCTVPISAGAHTLSSSGSGFLGIAYGTGDPNFPSSYGYAIGAYKAPTPMLLQQTTCTTGQVTLEVPAGFGNISWYNALDTSTLLGTEASYTLLPPITNGLYNAICVETISGCDTVFHYSVESPVPPVVSLTASDIDICEHQSIQLTTTVDPPSPLYLYNFTSGDGLTSTTIAQPEATPSSSAQYTVQVSTPGGCASASASVTVNVSPGGITRFGVTPESARVCAGSPVNLEVATETILWGDNFDPSVSWGDWQVINNGDASTVCGSVEDNALYFTGTGTRNAVTPMLNIAGGGTIYFSLKIATGTAPCDNAEPGDNVQLSYRTASGSWTVIATYLESQYPTFTNVAVNIPAGAISNATQFRWQQVGSWAGNQDNWCLDNVYISVNNTNSLLVQWTPATGLSNAFSPTPIATPMESTTYHVTVTDGPNGCVYTDSVMVNVGEPFTLDMTADTSLCDAQGLALQAIPSASGNYTYVWSPENDTSISSIYSAAPVVNPTSDAVYEVAVQSDFGCTTTGSVNVTVGSLLSLDINTSDNTLCEGQSVTLSAVYSGGGNDAEISWTNDLGLAMNGALITDTPLISTVYTATLTDVSSGCTITENSTVSVSPTFTISTNPASLVSCDLIGTTVQATASVGGAYNWSWSPAAYVDNINASAVVLQLDASGVLTVSATNATGCTATHTLQVQHITETTSLGDDVTACEGTPVILNTGWPDDYTFDWNNDSTTSSIEVNESGSYSVTVTSPFGCISGDEVMVTFHPQPEVNLGEDLSFCPGEDTLITAGSGDFVFTWYPIGTIGPTARLNEAGEYICVASNGFCFDRDTVEVTLYPFPLQPFAADTTVCFDDNPNGVVLRITEPGVTALWQDGSSGNSFFANQADLYTATLTTEQGCIAEFTTQVINLCPGAIYIPNAFSPDGDGINEKWMIQGDNVAEFYLRIYNKWGALIYQTDDMQQGWDGVPDKGDKMVNNEVYFYRVSYRLLDDDGQLTKLYNKFGNITVIR